MTTANTTAALAPLPPPPAAIRAELERLIVADLLGPAGGEAETLPGTVRVRDHYLVGLIAPKGTVAGAQGFRPAAGQAALPETDDDLAEDEAEPDQDAPPAR